MKVLEDKKVAFFLTLFLSLILIYAISDSAASTGLSLTGQSTTISIYSNPNPSSFGQNVILTAKVTGGPPNGELISFYDSNTLLGSSKITSGTATLKTSGLAAGQHFITAVYPGDTNFAASTSVTLPQTVQVIQTSISLTSTQSSYTYGQPVTFNVKIVGGVPNNDTVTFYDGFNTITTVKTLNGNAVFSNSLLSGGTHSITARYNGDNNFTASTSSPLIETVRPGSTSIAVTSSSVGRSITLTAKVTPSAGQVPNGEIITFYSNSTVIGTSTSSSGSASLVTSSLSAGTHSITASYPGDASLLPSTSQPITVTSAGAATVTSQSSCFLNVNLTSSSIYYVAPQQIVIYYTVKSGSPCSIPQVSGTLSLSSAVTGIVYSSNPINITGGVTSAPVTRAITVNSSQAPRGPNLAVLLLNAGSTLNITSTSFYVLQPANITIRSASVSPNNTYTGSPLYLTTKIINNGLFPAANASLNVKFVASNLSYSIVKEPIGKILPFQNMTMSFNPGIAGIPKASGSYIAVENVSFYSNYSDSGKTYSSGILYSNVSTATYIAYPNPNGYNLAYNTSSLYPTNGAGLGPLVVNSFPYYTDVLDKGPSDLGSTLLYDSGNYPITVNISIPNLQFGKVVLSTNSVSLLPSQNSSVRYLFEANPDELGTYLIPITLSIAYLNATPVTTHLYSVVNIHNQDSKQQQVLSSVRLSNNMDANVILTLLSLPSYSSYKSIVYTQLNSSIAPINDIVLTGEDSNITLNNNNYTLSWYINTLTNNNTAQVGYSIVNLTSPKYLISPSTAASSIRQTNLTIFTILGITKPQLVYPNATTNITVRAIYTGVNETTLALSLTGTNGGDVLNPRQTFTVIPDSEVNAKFIIQTATIPGNETFTLVTPGEFAPQIQAVSMAVQSKPPFTITEYLDDPRTIFGILTLTLYITTLVYGRARKYYRDRKLRTRTTVKNINDLRRLNKKIHMAILDDGTSKRVFMRHINKDGGLGGFVEESAIVGKDVIAKETTVVENDSLVSGNVKLLNNATVSNHAVVRGDATIYGNASVRDDAEIYGNAKVYGDAKVFGQCEIYDHAEIYGESEVFGDAHASGEAKIYGTAKVYGSAQVSGDAEIKSGKTSKGNIVT